MKNYKMTVQYDGTRYDGWQRQGNTSNTIQGKLENILERMTEHKVEMHGSGRTDKGVHAKGQVASFKIRTEKTDSEIMDYLNHYLPDDIAVTALSETDERFHARLNAVRKTYVYRIHNSSVPNVFEQRFLYTVEDELNVDAMKTAAKLFLGEHDFLGFSSVKKLKKSTKRTIYSVGVERFGDDIVFAVTGNGFLYNMVRIMAGTLVEIGKGERIPESITEVFDTKNRELAGITLPGKGLTLLSVEYE
ncbi:MAG: tRNA pseudouridine(38-40) synthase TruA [Ruminococcaceae bacterium]|nr:tRNA pseudouridine(38-40) synthase TruA [Oscillospiraceae bacterium]